MYCNYMYMHIYAHIYARNPEHYSCSLPGSEIHEYIFTLRSVKIHINCEVMYCLYYNIVESVIYV